MKKYKERDYYLNLSPVSELKNIIETLPPVDLGLTEIDTKDSFGRITGENIYAKFSTPHYNAAAMDGIATTSKLTFGATESNPVTISKENYIAIDTGQPVPDNFDTVIPEEYIEYDNSGNVILYSSFHPWNNIRTIGEDIVKRDLIIPVNSIIDEKVITLLLASGNFRVKVKNKPEVLIIPTGNEIISPYHLLKNHKNIENLKDGTIIDYDSYMVSTLLHKFMCNTKILDIIPDNPEKLKEVIANYVDKYSFICIIAGSSAGRKDFTIDVLGNLGKILIHGIKMMPGKPFMIAQINDRVIFGIPGFPASAYFTTAIFIKRYIERLLNISFPDKIYNAVLSRNVPSKLGYDEYIRVAVAEIKGETKAIPLKRGASIFKSINDSDGYFVIPSGREGINKGEKIEVISLRDNLSPDKNILFIGSNDISIDVIKSILAEKKPEFRIISRNLGSMGGLSSLKNNETHFAPTHLLNPETGMYNIDYIREIFPDKKVLLLGVAEREQGIIVKKGNPHNIKSLKDIIGKRFVNRQKGSGTRILFDYLLKREGIDNSSIKGYNLELYTHTAICNFISKGYADCGIGTKASADIFDLDFIPIAVERYELAFYKEFSDDIRYKIIENIILSENFKKILSNIGGYSFNITGQLREV